MDVLELLRVGGYSKIALVALEGVRQTIPRQAGCAAMHDSAGPAKS